MVSESMAMPKRKRLKMTGEGRVYLYGARPPLEMDLVRDQLLLAHRYRNELVKIELDRRAVVSALLVSMSPELAKVEELIGEEAREANPDTGAPAMPATGLLGKIAAAEAESRTVRSRERSRPKQDATELRAMRAELAQARSRRTALRKALFSSPEWQEASAKVEASAKDAVKAARAASGLYWGTYLAVEQAAMSFRKGAPPRFRPWAKRKDRLAVQIQGGMTVDELRGTDTRARLVMEPMPERRCDGCMARARRERRGQPHPPDARPCTCDSLPAPSKRRHAWCGHAPLVQQRLRRGVVPATEARRAGERRDDVLAAAPAQGRSACDPGVGFKQQRLRRGVVPATFELASGVWRGWSSSACAGA